jgi:hypothetical protein
MGRAHHATFAALALVASLSLSGNARAQQPPAAVAASGTSTPSRGPRIGYAGEAPKADSSRSPGVVMPPPVYYYPNDGYGMGAPTYLVLNDGSLLVNFGNGYERVLRSCAALRPAPVPRDQFGRDALGNMADPPGIAAMKAGSRGQASGVAPARDRVACYNADGQGRINVTTP